MAAATPSASKNINRAEVVDQQFLRHVRKLPQLSIRPEAPNRLADIDLLALFQCQLQSRQMDLMARVKRLENKVFYTIGSSGHEGNALLGQLTRSTDPAFLHYRSGGFMAARSLLGGRDFITDTARSFAASKLDPASGGRHKVWGSRELWVVPQTSTIASHLPKAVGTALAIAHAPRIGHTLEIPADSIAVCSFGDASVNHSTAQGAFNMAAWTAHQCLPLPLLMVCEDNGWGISVKTPSGWIRDSFRHRHGLHYIHADGLDLAAAYDAVQRAVALVRDKRRPVFLHLQTTRLMGHAGTDFEVDYRDLAELELAEARDPLLRSAELVYQRGLMSIAAIEAEYELIRQQCLQAADAADAEPRLTDLDDISAPLAPWHPDRVAKQAEQTAADEQRKQLFGARLPEQQGRKHMAILLNWGLRDLLAQYGNALLFGEDVAQKGGVYTITKGLQKAFGGARVFNTLLDEQGILGLAQGFGLLGYLPIPEIQYLAYFHNACDQIRGEACSLQYFSNDQFRNPMFMRIAGLGYQKGFGGHFHNDNSITALRDIPGLVLACPSRGDDAVMMQRTLAALAMVDGRVCAMLEPIALYMTKDLYQDGDSGWSFAYPAPGQQVPLGQGRVYFPDATELLIITYGNGVPMSLRVARQLLDQHGQRVRVLDLRWLLPLNAIQITEHASACQRILLVDEGRYSGGISEGLISILQEHGLSDRPLQRITGADCYTPLADAAKLVLPSEQQIEQVACAMLGIDTLQHQSL
ncbi:MAG: thiamine pyrophosphate-dependent enzyme [Wenzhouxiangellaceae bacterium]